MSYSFSPGKHAPLARILAPCLLLSACLALPAGCKPVPSPSAHGHSHGVAVNDDHAGHEEHDEDGHGVVKTTLWGETHELFVEYEPPLAGGASGFSFHVTDIATGLPMTEGPFAVTASREGAEPVRAVAESPERPGIFAVSLVFPSAGEWSLSCELPVPVVMSPVVVWAGDEALHAASHDGHDDGHGGHDAGEITFLKEQQWVVPLVTVPVVAAALTETHPVPATVVPTPETRGVAAAPLGGLVSPPEGGALPVPGDRVGAGVVLARVTPVALSAEGIALDANLQQAKSAGAELRVRMAEAAGGAESARALVRRGELGLARARELLEIKAGSRRGVEEAEAELASARAQLRAFEQAEQAARAALESLAGLPGAGGPGVAEVRAPIAGRVTESTAASGVRVEAGDPLYVVVNTDRVVVEALAPVSLLPRLASPPSARAELPGGASLPLGASWIVPELQSGGNSARIRFDAENAAGLLRLGMPLTVRLDGAAEEEGPCVPMSAVVDVDGQPVVYEMVSGESFARRAVRLGAGDGARVRVLSGVSAGARVVSSGAYAVRLAAAAGAGIASAHVH